MKENFVLSISALSLRNFILTVVLCGSMALQGCAGNNIQTRIENRLPRDSFVKIIAEANLTFCMTNPETKKSECISKKSRAYASGVIVDREQEGSIVLTAGHVCDTDDLAPPVEGGELTVEARILVQAENGERFRSKQIRIDHTIDSCLLFVSNMTRWQPIKIRKSPPEFGEKFYNLASPLGVATPEFIPILEGRYNGMVNFKRAAYSIPAAPGSSGSPIFDKRGHLVGMIHSVYLRFPILSFSPTHDKLLKFLER
tara:strand:+ start:636 stop:1403 length:768 start_codon:yes stop_codon:yes gene_type:complete